MGLEITNLEISGSVPMAISRLPCQGEIGLYEISWEGGTGAGNWKVHIIAAIACSHSTSSWVDITSEPGDLCYN